MLGFYALKPSLKMGNEGARNNTNSPENVFNSIPRKMVLKVRLFPRESQPSSCTSWWTITVKGKGFFKRDKYSVDVTANVGTKIFHANDAKFCMNNEQLIFHGRLEDGTKEGKYFVLRLRESNPRQMCSNEYSLYDGTLARSSLPFLLNEECGYEVTHDAVVYPE